MHLHSTNFIRVRIKILLGMYTKNFKCYTCCVGRLDSVKFTAGTSRAGPAGQQAATYILINQSIHQSKHIKIAPYSTVSNHHQLQNATNHINIITINKNKKKQFNTMKACKAKAIPGKLARKSR